MNVMTEALATTKQLNYLKVLFGQKFDTDKADQCSNWLERNAATITRSFASAKIEELRSLPYAKRQQGTAAEEGIYKLDGTIYKVQIAVHGSGRPYAKKLVTDDGEAWFESAPGMVYKLKPEHKLPIEEAETFGQLYGWCIRCGRTLTDEASIARGVGPICAEKF